MAVREKDNYETVTVQAKVAQKDKDGKRVKEVVDGKKVTVYDTVDKEIKKDLPSRLHARRQMASFFYPVTEVPTEAAGRKKNTKSISFSPKGSSDIFLLGIMPQGSSVKKGESVAQADFRILDKSIEDYERTIKSKNLEVLKLRYALDQQKERSALALQKYQTALTRTEEDQKDFLEKRKARMLAEEEERVNKALRHMSYKQEELNQLTKMYKDDQVAEETEEIILKRLKNELGESEFAVQGAKLVAELAKLRNIHRLGEDYATAVKEKQMDLEQARKQADFDLEQKKIALTEAEVSLRRLQDKYNELKADREMAAFKAPENGILLYGGYVADKWVAIPVAEKLKPGGKLYIVIRKQQGAPSAMKYLATIFEKVSVLEKEAGYWIIEAIRAE